jgi:hypothetical protein
MNTIASLRTRTFTLLVIGLASGATLGGCDKQPVNGIAPAGSVTSANLADKVEQARTPADHRALAQFYDERAGGARREATDEREARSRYESRWNSTDHPMGRGAREHYDHMIEAREGDASGAHAMAESHREMATQAEREGRFDE